jgi:3-phosphoshikimate 1-carboxyvinyltransferase
VEAALGVAAALGADVERGATPGSPTSPAGPTAAGAEPKAEAIAGGPGARAGAAPGFSPVWAIEGWRHEPASRVDCGESGLALRLFAALAALHDREIVLDGRGTLLARPVGMIEDALRACGVACRSQHVTGLLCALPLVADDTRLVVERVASRPYLAMTLATLRRFGVVIEAAPDFSVFSITGRQQYRPAGYRVEGDWSGASCLLVAGAIAGRVEVTNLEPDSAQADRAIVDVLAGAGARVAVGAASVTVEQGPLRAFEWDASDAPDLVPALAVLACCAAGESRIAGAARLRHKESDRVSALVDLIRALGGAATAEGDVLLVSGARLAGGAARTRHDHRMAMAASVAALVTATGVTIDDAECVGKSYPGFFEDLASVSLPARGGRR